MALADIHLDLVYALYETPPEDRELLAAYYLIDRGSRSKLAHDLGMKPAAMRKRVERIKAKIRK
jgi:hypothetical protein